jgi:hypothetical protein
MRAISSLPHIGFRRRRVMPTRVGQPCQTEAATARLKLLVPTFEGVVARAFQGEDRVHPRLRHPPGERRDLVVPQVQETGRTSAMGRAAALVGTIHWSWIVMRVPQTRAVAAEDPDACHSHDLFRAAVPQRGDSCRRSAPVRSPPLACNASWRRGRRSRARAKTTTRSAPIATATVTACRVPLVEGADPGGLRRWRPHLIGGRGSASADVGDRASSRAHAIIAREPVAACKARPVRRRARR